MTEKIEIEIRKAMPSDLSALLALEAECFDSDRLSKRSFRHWIKAELGELWVCVHQEKLLAYGLVWCQRGTRLSRLYSLAVSPASRGLGLAKRLLTVLEQQARQRGYLHMRLEVAKQNTTAIALYKSIGYQVFGEYCDYYDDHTDALRMQKTIRNMELPQLQRATPWYPQSTPFTCGPAALMMAMASLDESLCLTRSLELAIWREATTIYMTSGHGGCHPFGLAISAQKRGFVVDVLVNRSNTLFVDGVRSAEKKELLTLVHDEFLQDIAARPDIHLCYREVTADWLEDKLAQGCAVIVLISTYRLDKRKAPHWVVVTHADDQCFYVHDPDIDIATQQALDCQHMPIAKEDFKKMTSYGNERLSSAVTLRPVN